MYRIYNTFLTKRNLPHKDHISQIVLYRYNIYRYTGILLEVGAFQSDSHARPRASCGVDRILNLIDMRISIQVRAEENVCGAK